MVWTAERIPDEKTRKIVWAFAFCRAHKRDFGKVCHQKGWVKTTAYNRLNRTWDRLSIISTMMGWCCVNRPEYGLHTKPLLNAHICATVVSDEKPPAIKFSPGYRTEKSPRPDPDRRAISTRSPSSLSAGTPICAGRKSERPSAG
jgi:hypothetical protein